MFFRPNNLGRMERRIMYIEHKTNHSDRGEAWIGKVSFSKTGQTVYFNGCAFKKLKSSGVYANYYNIETGDEYWISGVKKNGQDRHWAGGGKVMVDKTIAKEYLELVDFDILSQEYFILVDILPTDKQKFRALENQ